jgi:hypothetical protein
MSIRILSALISAALLAGPCWAQKKPGVPQAHGSYAATDKYVDEYSKAMKSANAEINAIRTAIQAIQIPYGAPPACLAAAAAIAAQYGGIGAIMLKAESAHTKMLKHLMNADGSTDQEFDAQLGIPSFEGNKDDAPLKPKYDPTFGTQRPTQAVTSRVETLTASAQPSRPAGPGAPEAMGQKPSLNPISSKYGYGTPGKDVGVGFQEALQPSQHQQATQTSATIAQDNAASNAGAGASGSAMDSALGPTSGPGKTDSKSDEKPSNSQEKSELTQSNSDVAAKAYERMKKRQAEAQRRAEERRQKEEQKRKEAQQRRMQAAQMAAQFASQALQSAGKMMEQTGQNGMNAQQGGQQKESQAQQAAIVP